MPPLEAQSNHRWLPVHIRWLTKGDMAEVLDIEEISFPDPWQPEDFQQCLRLRNTIAQVCELTWQLRGQAGENDN